MCMIVCPPLILRFKCVCVCVCVEKVPRGQRVLMWLLAVLESVEVMLEVTSELAVGEPGKWAVVVLLQCVKALLRTVLVFYTRSGLLTTPAVPSPDRQQAKVYIITALMICTLVGQF